MRHNQRQYSTKIRKTFWITCRRTAGVQHSGSSLSLQCCLVTMTSCTLITISVENIDWSQHSNHIFVFEIRIYFNFMVDSLSQYLFCGINSLYKLSQFILWGFAYFRCHKSVTPVKLAINIFFILHHSLPVIHSATLLYTLIRIMLISHVRDLSWL